MLGKITLDQTQTFDHGNEGGSIALQSLQAALVDTGGSEVLGLALSGLPVGSILSDGTHSATVTADASGKPQAVDITGWNTASVSQDITVQVDAIAQAPSLTMTPPATTISRQLFATDLDGLCNDGTDPTVLDRHYFEGWTLTPTSRRMDPAYCIWDDGDQIDDGQGNVVTLNGTGDTQSWFGLSNDIGGEFQMPGLGRDIQTMAGATYTLNFDYAGQPGLNATNTQIGVYVDGKLLGAYSNTGDGALAWQPLHFSFQGDGQPHNVSIQLINGTDTSTARGAMVGGINLVETLPDAADTAWGFTGQAIALPSLAAALSANDPQGQLALTVAGLPWGAVLSDGHRTVVAKGDETIDLTGWSLAKLTVKVPVDRDDDDGRYGDEHRGWHEECGDDNGNLAGSFALNFTATCTEANGSAASITRTVTVNLLGGQQAETPAGVNPYVSYANSAASTVLHAPTDQIVVASPLVPLQANVSNAASCGSPHDGFHVDDADFDASMGRLFERLSDSIEDLLNDALHGEGKWLH